MNNISRDSFADEASYLTYLQHQAQRAKAQKQAEFRANNKALDARVLAPRVHALIKRMKKHKRDLQWYYRDKVARPEIYEGKSKRYYWRDPERSRQRHRDYMHRWRARDPEEYRLRVQMYHRIWWERHGDESKAARRARYQTDLAYAERRREYGRRSWEKRKPERREYRTAYMRALRRARGMPSAEERYAAARQFAAQVQALRAEGWAYKEIAELTGRSKSACMSAFHRVKRQQQREEGAA